MSAEPPFDVSVRPESERRDEQPASREDALLAERWSGEGTGRVRLQFFPTSIALTPPDGSVVRLSMSGFLNDSRLQAGGALVLLRPKRLHVQLTPEAQQMIRSWLEPVIDDHLAKHLREELYFAVPIGLFVSGNALRSEGGLLHWTSIVLGTSILLPGLLAFVRPHRSLWLVAGALWSLLAANTLWALSLGASRFQLGIVILALVFARSALAAYPFYGPAKPMPTTPNA